VSTIIGMWTLYFPYVPKDVGRSSGFVQTTVSCPLKRIGYDLAQTSINAPTFV
jgi:hypothetical protein